METVEAFVAEHKVEIEEVLYDWPASKFTALYEAYAKRKIADELSHRRSLEMAALWANTNLDQKDKPEIRKEWMEKVDTSYGKAIASLYGEIEEDEIEIDEDDPFWQAAKRGMEKHKLPAEPNIND